MTRSPNCTASSRTSVRRARSSTALPEFEVRLRTNRRTALVELFGELDIATVGQVADTFDELALHPERFRHVVLDLRGLTFMDSAGVHELVRRNDHANRNQHNLAIVQGQVPIRRVLAITAADALLVLIDDLYDVVPPLPAATWNPTYPDEEAQLSGRSAST
jgi:anti-anti-sigma factor